MNTTPLTPPPAEVPPQAPAPQTPAPRARASWITPVIAIVGSFALLFAIVTAVFVGIRTLGTGDSTQSETMNGVTALDIESSGAQFTLTYGNVDEAVLSVRGGREWRLHRAGSTLEVRPPVRWFGWWLDNEERVTLTLPTAYQTAGLDAALELSAGRLVAEGDFGRLDVEVNAGRADVTGSATRADVLVNAGRADVTLRDVAQARFDINAGRVEADLTGSAPDDVTIDVSAGELVLAVPNSVYDVRSNVSAGSFDNRLDTASTSSRTIDVQVSAGSATLRPGN